MVFNRHGDRRKKLSRKTLKMTKPQIKELDKLYSIAIQARDKKCIRCGSIKTLCASHIYPKGTYRKMRWDLDNAFCACYRCHMHFWHKDVILAHQWLIETLPEERLTRLKIRSQVIDKTPLDYHILKLYLQNEIKDYETI